MPKMDTSRLRAMVQSEIETSLGYDGGELATQRRLAMEYYNGELFGNETEGRSSFVSTDVQDTIETMMPDLMEIFAGGEEIVRFLPTGPEDEEQAAAATDYVNHIWNQDNPGFTNSYDWIKGGLLQKNGILKIWWDKTERTSKETLSGINELALQEFMDDPEIEILEATESESEFGPLYDLTIKRTKKGGRAKVLAVAPEEFLISKKALDESDANFTCHRYIKTRSELREEGYSQELVDSLVGHDSQQFNEERVARFVEEEMPDTDDSVDPAMQEIWVYETYMKVDFDGDGIAEMRMVKTAGAGHKILPDPDTGEDAVEVDDNPFACITPIRMPHKWAGRSIADLVMDIQQIKSTIIRELLNNMYNMNNARSAINERVNIDDYLTQRTGGVIRVEGTQPVGDAIQQIVTHPLGNYVFPMAEYFDGVRETRTGITRHNQGLDPDSLNKTASGMNQLLGRSQKKLLAIARLFAETGYTKAFKKILKLVVTHQDRPRMIRLRNTWVEMDPRPWNSDMDMTVSVGLGHGTSEDRARASAMLVGMVKDVIGMQGGPTGPFVGPDQAYNALREWTKTNGWKRVDQFFMDPQGKPMPPKQPDPKMVEMQMKGQIEQAKAETDKLKLQLQAMQAQQNHAEDTAKIKLDKQKLDLEAAVKAKELAIKKKESEFNMAAKKAELAQQSIKIDYETRDQRMEETVDDMGQNFGQMSQALEGVLAQLLDVAEKVQDSVHNMNKPKKIVRDKNGRAVGVETVQ